MRENLKEIPLFAFYSEDMETVADARCKQAPKAYRKRNPSVDGINICVRTRVGNSERQFLMPDTSTKYFLLLLRFNYYINLLFLQ